jgi:hypothetical protein
MTLIVSNLACTDGERDKSVLPQSPDPVENQRFALLQLRFPQRKRETKKVGSVGLALPKADDSHTFRTNECYYKIKCFSKTCVYFLLFYMSVIYENVK